MRTYAAGLLAVLSSLNVQAYSNLIANPYSPYPPACVTSLENQFRLYGDNVRKVFHGEVRLPQAYVPGSNLPVDLTVYRIPCAEPQRSVVMLEFSIPQRLDPQTTYYLTPTTALVDNAGTGFDYSWMPLRSEANSWGSRRFLPDGGIFGGNTLPGYTTDGHDKKWRFILDNPSPSEWNWSYLSPGDYNGWLEIQLDSGDPCCNVNPAIPIPPTGGSRTPDRIPLSGRLSGNWVVHGVSDQGFSIAISEIVENVYPDPDELLDQPLLMFLSWYTYDAAGDLLWLTGSARFEIGATQVTLPIERVSNGVFLGSKAAERAVVGKATITGNSCNDLTLEYDLSGIGLGTGSARLQRLFSLETAGYTCRDLEARIEAK